MSTSAGASCWPARAYYRMPLGYGPMPSPRQDTAGHPYAGWDKVKATVSSITIRTPRAYLATFLPHESFSIDGTTNDDPVFATFRFTRLENLPWLAGRGYNHYGLYIPNVSCRGADGTVRQGTYLSVLFENLADPIITGRDEVGYAKVFATLDDELQQNEYTVRVGWQGAQFGKLQLRGMQEADHLARSTVSAPALLHFKYIPRTGEPGVPDVQYAAMTPGRHEVYRDKVFTVRPEDAEVFFESLDFKDLPTLHHVAERLAGIKNMGVVEALMEIQIGSTDIGDQQKILV